MIPININDFIILVEEAHTKEVLVDSCRFEELLIAVALYGSGNVHLSMNHGDTRNTYDNTKGLSELFFKYKRFWPCVQSYLFRTNHSPFWTNAPI